MILNFSKPKKLRPTEQHNGIYSSDSGVAGTYVPNMSHTAQLRWKAKRVAGIDPRVEIRKTLEQSQLLIVVRPETVTMTANGRMRFGEQGWSELLEAVAEAKNLIGSKR